MFARCSSACVRGVDGEATDVEVHLRQGNPRFDVVGLADTAAREARDRVRSALVQSGYRFPEGRVLVNLAPAETPKSGAGHDLPMAIAILLADRVLPPDAGVGWLMFGELALDGRLRPVRGAFLVASTAERRGLAGIVAPQGNGAEAALATGLPVYAPETLAEAVRFLAGEAAIDASVPAVPCAARPSRRDFAEVHGQEAVKRALVVAACGGHNVLLVGPPGSGKTLLAERFADLLPPLEREQAIDVARIRSAAGLPVDGLPSTRPFRAPSCSASLAGVTGGGQPPRPGEITLANHGVLFLDELPQFRPDVLESLRQPLESGLVTLSRASGHVTFPSRFQLLTAMNPCPCGFGAGTPRCTCTPPAVQRYLSRISGPLIDRIDLRVPVPAVPYAALRSGRASRGTDSMASEVTAGREVQRHRFGGPRLNATMSPREMAQHCGVTPAAEKHIENAAATGRLSARGIGRVLRVARTVADLAGAAGGGTPDRIDEAHVLEVLRWRLEAGGVQ
ncbi:MAG: YifB family Mg chelatase-like AAA ATPase [Planctomycetes bacterium]|nr:YifB family Mg chelatase-like AAA ATPase [Planctomycetota bacterium]